VGQPPPLAAGLVPLAGTTFPVPTPRRYYLLKRFAAIKSQQLPLSYFWRAKQEAIFWPPLPANFPARAQLIAGGYYTVRDLDGATTTELQQNLSVTLATAQAVVAAMGAWRMIPHILKGYNRQDGAFAKTYAAPLAPDGANPGPAFTASYIGDTYEMGDQTCLRLQLAITAISGVGATLRAIIETSPDGVNNWNQVGAFGYQTTVCTENNVFPGCDRFVRANVTISGTTPSVTFTINGESVG